MAISVNILFFNELGFLYSKIISKGIYHYCVSYDSNDLFVSHIFANMSPCPQKSGPVSLRGIFAAMPWVVSRYIM